MYIDKLDSIVDKYNITHHRTIKMRPFDIKTSAILKIMTLILKIMTKILNLNLVMM